LSPFWHDASVPTTAIDTTADPALLPAFRAAREICRRHAKSFYFASFFLPKHKRSAAYAVYAFCRMIDDAIDQDDAAIESTGSSCCGGSSLDNRLAMFRDRLDEIFAGSLELPNLEFRSETQHALFAFSRTVERYEIPKEYFLDLAEGCRRDLTVMRYATWSTLENYCYHVAGVVGLIMSCIFGLRHSDAHQQAIAMGNAMQLTNILRDVKEDFARGRIYLPLEDMARFGYSESDLSRGVVNDSFRRLMRFEVARARQLYRKGAAGLCWLAGDGSRLTASAMAVIYSGILDAIERQHYDVFSRRAHLTTGQKLRRLPASWRLAKREDGEPMPRIF
jgi:phytoene synthase